MFLFDLIILPSAHYLSCIILHINSSSVSQAARRFSFWLKGGQSVDWSCSALPCAKRRQQELFRPAAFSSCHTHSQLKLVAVGRVLPRQPLT